MTVIQPYIDQVKKVRADIPKIAEDFIMANSEKILNLVKVDQLGKGLNSQGTPLVWKRGKQSGDGFYAEFTDIYAENLNTVKPKIAGQPYNFEWTGDTFNKMVIDIRNNNSFKIFTLDGKKALLEAAYGTIFSLNEGHNKIVNQWILHHLYQYLFENLFDV